MTETATGRDGLVVPGPRLASIGLLVLHILGAALALAAFTAAWQSRLFLQLLMERTVFFRLFHLPWTVIPAALALVAVLAAIELGRAVSRYRRGQAEQDLGLRLRALLYAALASLFVNVFLLSTPETFAGPFRVRFPINVLFSAAFAYGAYTLWFLLLPRLRRVFPDRVRHGLDVLGMNLALLLAFAELSLRILSAIWPSPLLVTRSSTSQITRSANRERPGTLRFRFPMNQGGHYDGEFAPRSATLNRIVVDIGDSFSYGAVPHAFHFTTVAERRLPGVEIYNMGYSGLGPSDYLYLLEHEARLLAPDLVVINLFVGNDVTEGQSRSGPARWYDADRYLLAIVWHRLQILTRAKLVDASQTRSSNATVGDLAVLYPWLTDPLLEPPSVTRETFLAAEARSAEGVCLPHEGLYPPFFETLAQMKRVASDVPLAFVVIPEEYQVEDDTWQEVVRETGQPLDRDLAQRTIVAWLNARGLPVLDLLPILRSVKPMNDGRRHLYHLQDMHFNARGNDVAGRALASFVDSLLSATPGPLPLPRHLAFGTAGSRQLMQGGWSTDETEGGRSYVWSDGSRSVFGAPLPNHGDVRMDFAVEPFVFPRSPEQRVTIVLNGTLIEDVPLRPGLHSYSVILPQRALRDLPNTLEFLYAYARAPREVLPNSPDHRTLAVAWHSIDFATVR